jgi:pyruvate formate lyase activating enzyme
MKKEAKFYIKKNDKTVKCNLCHHNCLIKPEHLGVCGIRKNIDGTLYSMTYGYFCSVAVDPIEKKPLYHFFPGSDIISLGSVGCNLKCFFCQNYDISQKKYDELDFMKSLSAQNIIDICNKYSTNLVAFTYNEPLIMFEYLIDVLPVLKKNKIETVLVTNGTINIEAAKLIANFISAANIDLKSFTQFFYTEYCKGNLEYVKSVIKCFYESGVHIELTNLIIPTLNDNLDDISNMINWIADISPKIPMHFSRYFPRYKSKIEPTDIELMNKAYNIAKEKLEFVYLGNVG